MTPTASRLLARLDERRRWFHNEWFFKWHHIRNENGVQIDTFDGRQASFGDIEFSGSAMDLYWDAIVRGVRKEIVEQLAWVDTEVRAYNAATALRAIDECAGLLVSFVRSVRRTAVEKDRILRGDGINFPTERDAGHWEAVSAEEIQAQAEALKNALPAIGENLEAKAKGLTGVLNQNPGWLAVVGILVAVILAYTL